MARRYYSSTAVATTLSSSASNSDTSIDVTALSGYPVSTPWTAIIDPDTASEEVVEVTNVSGTTLTVTRGVDGTSGVSHSAGAVFRHGVSARDFDEANDHVNDTTTDVHSQYVLKSLFANKGTIAAASAASTPAALSVGSDGQMLMADSSATAGLRYVDPPANRNLIINGAMQVSQRSSSVASISSGINTYHTADRWSTSVATLGTWTQSIEADAPTGSGLRRSLKMLCTTADAAPAANDLTWIRYAAEGQDVQRIKKGTSSAEQLTLSFWVKSNVTGTYVASLFDNDNSRSVGATYTVSASATWEKKTITFPADTTGVLDNDNFESLALYFLLAVGSTYSSGTLSTTWASHSSANFAVGQTNLAAATNNYWQVTGVQLETGPVATPFEFEPFEATLRKCQRYYQRSLGTGMSNLGAAISTSEARAIFQFERTMRAAPTITLQPVGGGAGQAIFLSATATTPGTLGTHAAAEITANRFRLTGTGYTGAFVAGQGVFFWTNTTDGVVYEASAEL